MNKFLKRPRYLWVLFCLSILIVIFIFIYPALNKNKTDYSNITHDTVTEEAKVFTTREQLGTQSSGIPKNTVKDILPGIGMHWTQESVVDGSDTCMVFDQTSLQIYASSYSTAGFNGTMTSESGTTYYMNSTISMDDALKLLSDSCYSSTSH